MSYQLAISSMSLGYAWAHDFETKAEQAQKHSIRGLEIFYQDLEKLAEDSFGKVEPETLLLAADKIHGICVRFGLSIICIQPFGQYEGLRSREEHAARIEKAKLWFQLAHRLHTDIIAIPASFLDKAEITDDLDVIVKDLTEVVDLGAQENIRFVYEALAWSTYIDTWEQTWEVVQRVDRANFGLCLDTFNIAGRIFADPTSPCGKTKQADERISASMRRLVESVDVSKVFYIQVVDGERLKTPLGEGHEYFNSSQPYRMMWSRGARLFYGEEDKGAYLPIKDIMKAIIDGLGYKGWISMEYFNSSLDNQDPYTPAAHARRALESWTALKRDLGL